jgi:nitroimidazol reductase NimA-like FMN-containing flavoprotein (pyridoxamine 5'-phosphate oxidase superfamily)
VEVDRNGLEVLDRDECLRLLATATIGRIAISRGALPMVLPVSYELRGDRVLLCARSGTALAGATGAVVAFEADAIDPQSHDGWSVMVVGVARHAGDAGEEDHSVPGHLARWGGAGDLVEVSTELTSGRRTRS